MSRVTLASKATIRPIGEQRQQDDAVGEDQPVAAVVQLARQVAVLGQDRGQQREAVEGGVGGEDEDRRGDGLHAVEEGRPSPKMALAIWASAVCRSCVGRQTQFGRVAGHVHL